MENISNKKLNKILIKKLYKIYEKYNVNVLIIIHYNFYYKKHILTIYKLLFETFNIIYNPKFFNVFSDLKIKYDNIINNEDKTKIFDSNITDMFIYNDFKTYYFLHHLIIKALKYLKKLFINNKKYFIYLENNYKDFNNFNEANKKLDYLFDLINYLP